MPIVDLYGHIDLRERLSRAADEGTLPASLLLHGPRGIGKQRLALWLAQLLLCENKPRPCGECQNCRYSRQLTHPDLHWYFPRPRLKNSDPGLDDVREDYLDAIAERAASAGLYATPPGSEAIYVAAVRAILREAAMAPAVARRKVFLLGDAERMVAQEGADQAANAFLKLLEEPDHNTSLILTSSEPGALLPTIRSRTVSVRVRPLDEMSMRAFLADPAVARTLALSGSQASSAERIQSASGAPGSLFREEARARAVTAAKSLLEAATSRDPSIRHAAALAAGGSGSRGAFSETLDSLMLLLAERMRRALRDNDQRAALGATKATDAVGRARIRAGGNVNPMLIASKLLRELAGNLS